MKEKSIYKKDELMSMSKEFLIDTILRLDKNVDYYKSELQDCMKQWKETIDSIKRINNK